MTPILRITALSTALLLNLCGAAHAAKVDKRWFEVEVILFSQLGDKTKLLENFSGESTLPNYRHVIDLLTPYIHPNTNSLRLQLPSCELKQYPVPFIDTQAKLPALHTEKSLEELSMLVHESSSESNQLVSNESLNVSDKSELLVNDLKEAAFNEDVVSNTNVSAAVVTQDNSEDSGENSPNVTGEINNEVPPALVGLTKAEIALVEQAELAFTALPLTFNYQNITTFEDTLCQPIVTNENSTVADFYALADHKNSPDFPVEQLTGTIDGNEFIDNNQPYLIDADSLKLKDITLQLRRSKNFRPLLHLGWRQPLTNRKKPSLEPAIRLFSGQHYQQSYQDQLSAYQQAITESALAELSSDNEMSPDVENEAAALSPIAQRIHHIIDAIDTANLSTDRIIEELDSPALTVQLNELASQTVELTPPVMPNQDWYLDGYFRLHLNHYLFITADFNVAVPNGNAQNNDESKKPFKLIPFKQNKRVISKEVHYFDHPYMGMVVQIRRYKKPEPQPDIAEEKTTMTEQNNG